MALHASPRPESGGDIFSGADEVSSVGSPCENRGIRKGRQLTLLRLRGMTCYFPHLTYIPTGHADECNQPYQGLGEQQATGHQEET